MRYVEDNLHDPEISPERIALAVGCSKRTLHRTFDSGSGDESLNRYLWRRRIERCAAELRSLPAASRRQTVTEIAYCLFIRLQQQRALQSAIQATHRRHADELSPGACLTVPDR
jgi:transcriptional regulator GlxA family with amidase domain